MKVVSRNDRDVGTLFSNKGIEMLNCILSNLIEEKLPPITLISGSD